MAGLDSEASTTLKFLITIGKLKHLKRTGWVHRRVQEPESVACHMYRMSIMGMLIPDTLALDKQKVIKMALVHDMAEALAGDITPHCGVSEEQKYDMEKKALTEMTSHIPDKTIGNEIFSLWQEYEEQTTAEAKMVKDFDKFDMILQAYEYETSKSNIGPGGLQEFFDGVEGKLKSDLVKGWDAALKDIRKSA